MFNVVIYMYLYIYIYVVCILHRTIPCISFSSLSPVPSRRVANKLSSALPVIIKMKPSPASFVVARLLLHISNALLLLS